MPELDALLEGIDALRGARVLGELGGGEASRSWRLRSNDGDLVLRVDQPLARRLGLDRQREWEVLCTAHAAGLGPEPVWADAARGLLVTRWLEGRAWAAADLGEPGRLATLGELLGRVHSLPGPGQPFDPLQVAETYARAAGARGDRRSLTTAVESVGRLAADLYSGPEARCLCHNDPNVANLLGAETPRLIDWEYAAAGLPLFDLAVIVRYHALDRRRARLLLAAWSGVDDPAQFERLRLFGRLYDQLARLWHQVVMSVK